MHGLSMGSGWWGRRWGLFLFSFPCIPCPFTVLQGQGEPKLGLATKEPNVASSPLPSPPLGVGNRESPWAGQEQDSMSSNLPWRKGQQGGKALNGGQRRGEGADSQPHEGGRAGNLLPGPQIQTGEERMATEHTLSICGKERWPQASKVCLGPTLRSSDERC